MYHERQAELSGLCQRSSCTICPEHEPCLKAYKALFSSCSVLLYVRLAQLFQMHMTLPQVQVEGLGFLSFLMKFPIYSTCIVFRLHIIFCFLRVICAPSLPLSLSLSLSTSLSLPPFLTGGFLFNHPDDISCQYLSRLCNCELWDLTE